MRPHSKLSSLALRRWICSSSYSRESCLSHKYPFYGGTLLPDKTLPQSGLASIDPWHTQKSFISQPKKKEHFKVGAFDDLMDEQRRFRLVLVLKDVLLKRPGNVISMRDLKEECAAIDLYLKRVFLMLDSTKRIFKSYVDRYNMEWIGLTEEAKSIIAEEDRVRKEIEPQIVNNLRKLLMLSRSRMLHLKAISQLRDDIGLAMDFETDLVHRYPRYFYVVSTEKGPFLKLVEWDPSLAVSERERKAKERKAPIHSFWTKFPSSMRRKQVERDSFEEWQSLPFPSPYDDVSGLIMEEEEALKRATATIHELLSLLIEKRTRVENLWLIQEDLVLPKNLSELLRRHVGIFYVTLKGFLTKNATREYVFLKEGYNGSELNERGPLVVMRERLASLMSPLPPLLEHRRTERAS